MAVPVLSVITHVYNAQGGVDEQLDSWRTLPAAIREKPEFDVIGDNSDSTLTDDASGLTERLFRVLDDIDWNMVWCHILESRSRCFSCILTRCYSSR